MRSLRISGLVYRVAARPANPLGGAGTLPNCHPRLRLEFIVLQAMTSAERKPGHVFRSIRRLPATVTAVALAALSLCSPCATAVADPGQDQKFFDLLGEKDIPPVDNANSLIATAKKACSKLDDGMPVGDLVELIRNNGFNENPLTRLQPQDRITRTIDRFINASVEAYCPYDKGKIASIAAYRLRPSASRLVVLASFVEPLPAGEISPTKPLPVPAQPPPLPEEIRPPPQQPPPPRHTGRSPRRHRHRRSKPSHRRQRHRRPNPGPPPASAPGGGGPGGGDRSGGAPGGGAVGGDAPASPTPDQPAPPGHIRLAP